MYPADTLDYPDEQAKQHLPLEHIYVLSIEDFERLIRGVCASPYSLPSLLADCVNTDLDPETSAYYFEMHLDRLGVEKKYSDLVHSAFEDAHQRLRAALEGRRRNT